MEVENDEKISKINDNKYEARQLNAVHYNSLVEDTAESQLDKIQFRSIISAADTGPLQPIEQMNITPAMK